MSTNCKTDTMLQSPWVHYSAKTISCSICSHPTFSSSPPGRSSGGTCSHRGTVTSKCDIHNRWRKGVGLNLQLIPTHVPTEVWAQQVKTWLKDVTVKVSRLSVVEYNAVKLPDPDVVISSCSHEAAKTFLNYMFIHVPHVQPSHIISHSLRCRKMANKTSSLEINKVTKCATAYAIEAQGNCKTTIKQWCQFLFVFAAKQCQFHSISNLYHECSAYPPHTPALLCFSSGFSFSLGSMLFVSDGFSSVA